MKNVIIRSLSGIVYVALIVVTLLTSAYAFYAVMAVFAVIATTEYQNLIIHRSGTPPSWVLQALDMTGVLMVLSTAPAYLYPGSFGTIYTLGAIAVYMLARMSASLAQTKGDPFAGTATSVLGILYIAAPLTLLSYSVMTGNDAPKLVLGMFILIWLNDTGAFCAGSMFGRRRLCERLSPKKSWEGFWGGMLLCIIAAAVTAYFYEINIPAAIGFAIIVSIFSTWGDLFESMLKRSAGVKDAGHIMPGHGGVLDRIDSLLFVAPAIFIYMLFF